ETVLARQNFAVELEGHLRLGMQRGRHVDRGVIDRAGRLGTAEPDVFRARVGADPAQKFGKTHAGPFTDRAPALDADVTGDLALLRQSVELDDGPGVLVVEKPADFVHVVFL